jgi:diguanylate cyclase (GGDEF)-like protein
MMRSLNHSVNGRETPDAAFGRMTNAALEADTRRVRPRPIAAMPVPASKTAAGVEAAPASRHEFDAALREIDALRKRVAALVQAVAVARRFGHRDELTGLPNRRLLLNRFRQSAAQCDRQHKQIALLFLDLDGFKRVNDKFGHAAGDAILQQVAARLARSIRISDTACRYGGDEFVVMLPEIEGEAACGVADKIRLRLARPYAINGTEVFVTVSLGIAIYPVDGKTCGDLIAASDRAMYRSRSIAIAPSVRIENTL